MSRAQKRWGSLVSKQRPLELQANLEYLIYEENYQIF